MLTIHGNRKVKLVVRVDRIEGEWVYVTRTAFVEDEILDESKVCMRIGDTLVQDYELKFDGQPLTQADLMAKLRGE